MTNDLLRLGRDPMWEALNLSAWESVESLWAYAFSGVHLDAVKRGEQRSSRTATPEGFTFRRRSPAPG